MFEDLVAALARVDRAVSDAERVDLLTGLERVKAACAGLQARVTVDLAESQAEVAAAWTARAKECSDRDDFEGWRAAREQARRASIDAPVTERGAADGSRSRRRSGQQAGVAGQVALARRESPSRGARHLTAAFALVRQLPQTLAALEAGAISEWRAEIVVREVGVLTVEQQSAVDAELFDTLGLDRVGALGDRELQRRVRAIAYRLDAASVVNRCRGAAAERRTSLRPAPDAMCYLTAYLPVAQGVAAHAALTQAAAVAKAAGDERSTGQVMADTLVERVTGQATAGAVPVEVQVVITDRALFTRAFDDDSPDDLATETPAQVPGYGTVPAAWARDLLLTDQVTAWLRRLYTRPEDGTLASMDSRRRVFGGLLRSFLIARDGTCRTPWCDAPIREIDHVVGHAEGGPTTAENGQGLCVRCNRAKQAPGWRARAERAGPPEQWRAHTVVTTTPTGHEYASTAPPVIPGLVPREESPLERHWASLLAA